MTPAEFAALASGFDAAADEYLTRSGTRGEFVWLHPAADRQENLAVLTLEQEHLVIIAPGLPQAQDVAKTILTDGRHLVGDLHTAALVHGRAGILAARSRSEPVTNGRGRPTSDLTVAARLFRLEIDALMRAAKRNRCSAASARGLAAMWGVCSDSTLRSYIETDANMPTGLRTAACYALAQVARMRIGVTEMAPSARVWITEALQRWFASLEMTRAHALQRQTIRCGVAELMLDPNHLPEPQTVPYASNLDNPTSATTKRATIPLGQWR